MKSAWPTCALTAARCVRHGWTRSKRTATAVAERALVHLATHYVLLTIGRNVPGGTETDYVDDYWNGRPTPKEYQEMIPKGWKQIGKARIEERKR